VLARGRKPLSQTRHDRVPAIVTAAVVLGVALRARQYIGQRSLWVDEASIALNLAARDFLGLLRPLRHNQTAPILFLWLEELATRVGGHDELALRFLPLACGVVLLPVFWSGARRMLDSWAATCALLLIAVSPILVYHANEAKPYAGDALAFAAVLVLALRTLDAPADHRGWTWLALGGLVALAASTPAAFVVGGVAVALVMEPRVRRDPIARLRAAAVVCGWAAMMLLLYFLFYRQVAHNQRMQRYWDDQFLPVDWSLPRVLWREAVELLDAAFLSGIGGDTVLILATIAIALAAVGAPHLVRRQGASRAALLVAPIGLALVAAFLRRYPLQPRLLLFVVPPLAILLLAGLSAGFRGRYPALRIAGFALLFGFSGVTASWRLIRSTEYKEEARAVIEAYQQRADGAPIFVFGGALRLWVYYTGVWAGVDSTRLSWSLNADRPLVSARARELWHPIERGGPTPTAEMHAAERVREEASPCAWLLFAHDPRPRIDGLLAAFEEVGGSVRLEVAARRAELHRVCFDPR
jgi:4-amino-4-deoxy-L-arabinose transferase-like glycosyltransferase